MRKARRAIFKTDPEFRDPYLDATAQYYARIYLRHFDAFVASFAPRGSLAIIDVGCNTGRLAIPLAERGHQVTAVDPSGFALGQAKRHAKAAGVDSRITFVKSPLAKISPERGHFDIVVATEVLYLLEDLEASLALMRSLAKPGGLLFASHRPRFFYLAQALGKHDFEAARFVKEHSSGTLWGSFYNWQSERDLAQLYERAGLEVLAAKPMGCFSEGSAEAMGKLVDVSTLAEEERDALFEIESEGLDDLAFAARYVLVLARSK